MADGEVGKADPEQDPPEAGPYGIRTGGTEGLRNKCINRSLLWRWSVLSWPREDFKSVVPPSVFSESLSGTHSDDILRPTAPSAADRFAARASCRLYCRGHLEPGGGAARERRD